MSGLNNEFSLPWACVAGEILGFPGEFPIPAAVRAGGEIDSPGSQYSLTDEDNQFFKFLIVQVIKGKAAHFLLMILI